MDPYSGEQIAFERGVAPSSEVQIDHVVALSNAWQTGAFKLTYERRLAFANDPMNLLAVKGRLNSQKGHGDAATRLRNGAMLKGCVSGSRYIAYKTREFLLRQRRVRPNRHRELLYPAQESYRHDRSALLNKLLI